MNNQLLLIGSLSNDLLRVANLVERGSQKAALNFWKSGQEWTKELLNYENKPYIRRILVDVMNDNFSAADKVKAEKYLMQSILLQNAALHFYEANNNQI